MLIDWFTVGAQALNFIILVLLMKRFLYKPILHAIDEREIKIAAELANADNKKAEAQKESDEFKRKNEEIELQRAALLTKATDEAKAERQRLLDEARKAASSLSSKLQEKLESEQDNLHQAISRRTQQEVFSIARKALADLATTSLEESMSGIFTLRLREMDSNAKAVLAVAIKTSSEPAIVRSAFDLPDKQRETIQNALNETFSSEIHIRFETAPDIISGIELTANGQKVAWSIADYLASMKKEVDELLNEKEAMSPSGLTAKISKRAYELYEQGGRNSDSAIQNWNQAEQEIRKHEIKAEETKSEAKTEEDKPVTKTEETKPEAKTEEAKLVAKTEENKPLTKTEETKPEAKNEEAKLVAKTEEAKPEAKTEKDKPATRS